MPVPVVDFLWALHVFPLSLYLGVQLWGRRSLFSPQLFGCLVGASGECRLPMHPVLRDPQDRSSAQPSETKTCVMRFPSPQMSDMLLYTYPQKDGKYRLKNTLAVANMKVNA